MESHRGRNPHPCSWSTEFLASPSSVNPRLVVLSRPVHPTTRPNARHPDSDFLSQCRLTVTRAYGLSQRLVRVHPYYVVSDCSRTGRIRGRNADASSSRRSSNIGERKGGKCT